MILVDEISAYYYMIRDGIPIYSDGKPAYLNSIRGTIINYLGTDSLEITADQVKRRSALGLLARTLQRKLFAECYSYSTRCKRMSDLWS